MRKLYLARTASALVWLALPALGALTYAASAQTAEEVVQKQLGQLMIANANCSVQTMTANSELQKARAEIEGLKKQLADAKPVEEPKK